MKFRSLLATLAVVFSLLFAACEVPSGIILGEDDVTFDITISDVTTSGATVNVVPSDKTVLYYFDKVEKSTYEAYKSDYDFMKYHFSKAFTISPKTPLRERLPFTLISFSCSA